MSKETVQVQVRASDDLARSGLSVSDASAVGIFEVEDASEIYPEFKAVRSLILPYYTTEGKPLYFKRSGFSLPFCRVRYLFLPKANGFHKPKFQKYSQPRDSGVHAYFTLGVDWPTIFADPKIPLLITEGEKKAVKACNEGFPTIGLGGVYNFLVKETGQLIPELAAITWAKRHLFIVYDSDAAFNPNVQAAEARLVDELMRERGAKVTLIRLPPSDTGDKVGLDDFLVAHGADAFERLCNETHPLGAVDAAVVSLNKHIAWIEREGLVYNLNERFWIPRTGFLAGSQYSSITAKKVITTGKKPGFKEVSVAAEWLKHPHARRYSEVLFRPGEPLGCQTVTGAPALNLWTGWEAEPGDVEPFLTLNDYLFSELDPSLRDWALKLMAYKAQNPQEKPALAVVLLSDQGVGKSLWSGCLADAFAPYSKEVDTGALMSGFRGWIEKTILAVINEAKRGDLEDSQETLKSLISETSQSMNEKYRVERQVDCFTSFIITANDRAVGAFSHDDRRMFVAGGPPVHPEGRKFYAPIFAWRKAGGGKHLMHYLLNYDLQGWIPPIRPPSTSEKSMAHLDSLSPLEQLADDMRNADRSTVLMWCDLAEAWADQAAKGSNAYIQNRAQETLAGLADMTIRPFYTPEEIATMFPAITGTLYGAKVHAAPAGEISKALRNAGIPYLKNKNNPTGFLWGGRMCRFLIVHEQEEWKEAITQEEFDRAMKNFPKYNDARRAARRERVPKHAT